VKRGDVWIWCRFGHEHKVVVVGDDGLAAQRKGVLVVPISDVIGPGMVEPVVCDASGTPLGVAQVPRVGEVHKTSLTSQAGMLAPGSVEVVDMALRVALAL
jgi:mRNA-degrading endonuclease toxin of MazEF toxin-antitoxin module